MSRPLHRIFLVAPKAKGFDYLLDALIERLIKNLHAQGVRARRHIAGSHFEGAPADVAIWFPDMSGALVLPNKREAPARVHAAFVVSPDIDHSIASHYDALLSAHELLSGQIKKSAPQNGPPVFSVRLPLEGEAKVTRAQAKRARGAGEGVALLVDLRGVSEANIDRVFFQLAIAHPNTFVVLTERSQKERDRIRKSALKHEVPIFLTSGQKAFTDAALAVDALLGAPLWAELFLAAAHQLFVFTREEERHLSPLFALLRDAKALSAPVGLLQLAARLDGALSDEASLKAKGTMLRSHLCGSAAAFAQTLSGLRERAQSEQDFTLWEKIEGENKSTPSRKRSDEKQKHDEIEEALQRMRKEIEDAK